MNKHKTLYFKKSTKPEKQQQTRASPPIATHASRIQRIAHTISIHWLRHSNLQFYEQAIIKIICTYGANRQHVE